MIKDKVRDQISWAIILTVDICLASRKIDKIFRKSNVMTKETKSERSSIRSNSSDIWLPNCQWAAYTMTAICLHLTRHWITPSEKSITELNLPVLKLILDGGTPIIIEKLFQFYVPIHSCSFPFSFKKRKDYHFQEYNNHVTHVKWNHSGAGHTLLGN